MVDLGILLAIREAGLHCPQDISIMGFDDLDLAERTNPSLSSVFQSGYQLGTTAARHLLDRIERDTEPQNIFLPTSLKLRDSWASSRRPGTLPLRDHSLHASSRSWSASPSDHTAKTSQHSHKRGRPGDPGHADRYMGDRVQHRKSARLLKHDCRDSEHPQRKYQRPILGVVTNRHPLNAMAP